MKWNEFHQYDCKFARDKIDNINSIKIYFSLKLEQPAHHTLSDNFASLQSLPSP